MTDTLYICKGHDRAAGAIGSMQPFARYVRAACPRDAEHACRDQLYAAGRDHVVVYTCSPARSQPVAPEAAGRQHVATLRRLRA